LLLENYPELGGLSHHVVASQSRRCVVRSEEYVVRSRECVVRST
jgi:hypothetical protein